MRVNEAVKVITAGSAAVVGGAGAVSADASDFEGFFIGGGLTNVSATLEEDYQYSGSGLGGEIFAGYNFVTGNLIIGAEVSTAPSIATVDGYSGTYGITSLNEVKLRLGTAVNNTMFYAAVGASSMGVDYGGGPDDPLRAVGVGVGFETNVTDNMFVGAEVMMRNVKSDPDGKIASGKPVTTTAIRVGWRF